MIHGLKLLIRAVAWTTLALSLAAPVVLAQRIELTPEQQRMLDQLPPEQRQQVILAIQQIQQQQPAAAPQTINEPLTDPQLMPPPTAIEQLLLDAQPRAQARSRLVIDFQPAEDLSGQQERLLEEDAVLERLIGSHVFVLDESGVLSIQGLEVIPLLGLNEEDISRRLEAEPYLSVFEIETRILSQKPIGVEALEPFGYEIFEPRDDLFDAPETGPVPEDYVVGPGDSISSCAAVEA